MNAELQPPEARAVFYERERRSVHLARTFTCATLAGWSLSGRRDDVLLCVSELATNALLHGVPRGRGYLLRLVRHGGGVLRVEVHDSGSGEVRVPEPSVDAEGGRGLLLVTALSDKWGVEPRSPGKIVWCEFAHRS
ncbi:ATP-binding protein [Streptomyces sp. NPDC051452]|uniref:ATP-binding protein n=1 Tax=Streptomyces sp. NPDC051452 TaxID=3365654 RepID=UPI003788D956